MLRALYCMLCQVHEDIVQCNELLARFETVHPAEWDGLVAVHRHQLRPSFFAHLDNIIHAASDDKVHTQTRCGGLPCSYWRCASHL